jgi:putative hydrolase of the HAD superfamily
MQQGAKARRASRTLSAPHLASVRDPEDVHGRRRIDHVVFDFGDVLNHHLKAAEEKQALVQAAGMPPRDFFARYWAHRAAYDCGACSPETYWRAVLTDPHPDRIVELRAIDTQVAVRLNFDMWRWVRQLKRSGKRLSLLSNMPSDLARSHERMALHDNFDHVFFSCDLGLMKPDPQIYRIVTEQTGLAPQRTLFLDDSQENIAAAKALGWQVIHFRSAEQAAIAVHQAFDLPPILP